jgi:hypothetical protein
MEEFLFKRPAVTQVLKRTVEARLHTDGFGEHRPISERNKALQTKLTKTLATPVYVVLDPETEEVLGVFEGATQSEEEFLDWFRSAIDRLR